MASERIELRFGAKNETGAAFSALQGNIKGVQDKTRDASESAKRSLSAIAGQLGGECGQAVQGFSAALDGLAAGGVWGILGALATTVISQIAQKWREAEEATKFYGEMLANQFSGAVSAVTDRFKSLTGSITSANAEAKSLLALVNGEVAHNAEVAIHKLHMETLQKLTDDMSASARNVVLADEALQAAKIRYQAVLDQSVNSRQAAEDAVAAATSKRQGAEQALADATALRAEYEAGEWFGQRAKIEAELAIAEEMYKQKRISSADYIEKRNYWVNELKSYEEQYAKEIQAHAAAVKAESDLSAEVAKAKAEETAATREMALAKMKEATASNNMEKAVADAEMKVRDAARANEASMAAEIAKADAAAKKAEEDRVSAEITKICSKYQVDATDYIKAYTEAIAKGMSHTEAYGELQKKLNDEIEKRTKAEKDAASGAGSGGKTGEGGTKGKPVYVSLSTSISDEINKVGGKTWGETQKEARRQHSAMMKDALPLYRAMKGQMPKDQQKLFEQYMMGKYSPDQVKKIWAEAQRLQLFDKKEREKQTKYLNAMVEAMKKQGLK